MTKSKRLFLFASYDKDNIVDNAVIYYVSELSKIGDVIFFADNDLPDTELKKISTIPNVLYANAKRHLEYDFGSYKRGYLWAKENKILDNYDWAYFVNDSVFGPLFDISHILETLESSDAQLVGMTQKHSCRTPLHVQSWFVGFTHSVFTSDFFDTFINKIKHENKKIDICFKYEVGLSNLILRHGFKIKTLITTEESELYKNPRLELTKGLPFIKKSSIGNIRKIYSLYPYLDNDVLLDYIKEYMNKNNIKMIKDSYTTVYELLLFKIPLLTIRRKNNNLYKTYLFRKIPFLRIIKG